MVGGRSSSLHLAARFRFAIFDSAEHAQAALEKIQAQPLEGPPCPLHVRFYNAPDSDVKKGSPSDTLYFGQLSPKVKVVDVEALLKQFPGFVSLDQGAQCFCHFFCLWPTIYHCTGQTIFSGSLNLTQPKTQQLQKSLSKRRPISLPGLGGLWRGNFRIGKIGVLICRR